MKYVYLFLPLLYIFGCHASVKNLEEKPVVAVSILPLRTVVEQLSGGDFDVLSIVPPGVNPETHEPTAAQMKAVSDASLFFQIGLLDFEQVLAAGIEDNAPDLKIVDLSEGLPLLTGHEHPHFDNTSNRTADPHVWLSPARMRTMIERITENLSTVRPDSARKYEQNRDVLVLSIDSLDRYIKHSFSELKKHGILIYHPSLTYYADDYGLHQFSVEADGKEPSAAGLREVVQVIRAYEMTTVFYQKQLSRNTIDALCREAGLKAVPFDPLAPDWLANLYLLTDEIRISLSDE